MLTSNILLSDVFPSTRLLLYQPVPTAFHNRTLCTATECHCSERLRDSNGVYCSLLVGLQLEGNENGLETCQTFLVTVNSIAILLCSFVQISLFCLKCLFMWRSGTIALKDR